MAALCDILARGGVRVTVANVDGHLHHIVKLAKGTDVQADKPIEFCVNDEYDVIAVPGGPGAKTLGACRTLVNLLKEQKGRESCTLRLVKPFTTCSSTTPLSRAPWLAIRPTNWSWPTCTRTTRW